MVSVLFGVQGKGLLDQYRLQGSAELVKNQIEKTKFLSLAYRADVELFLLQSKKGCFLQLSSDEPGLAKAKSLPLPGIIEVISQQKRPKQLKLVKFSSGQLIESSSCELRGKKIVWKMDAAIGQLTRVDQEDS